MGPTVLVYNQQTKGFNEDMYATWEHFGGGGGGFDLLSVKIYLHAR